MHENSAGQREVNVCKTHVEKNHNQLTVLQRSCAVLTYKNRSQADEKGRMYFYSGKGRMYLKNDNMVNSSVFNI